MQFLAATIVNAITVKRDMNRIGKLVVFRMVSQRS